MNVSETQTEQESVDFSAQIQSAVDSAKKLHMKLPILVKSVKDLEEQIPELKADMQYIKSYMQDDSIT